MIGSGTDHAEALGLRHLRVFEMVSRLGSIRKASDAVHLSQPAVTQAMIKLERQIGVPATSGPGSQSRSRRALR